jgi:hypothetical protein
MSIKIYKGDVPITASDAVGTDTLCCTLKSGSGSLTKRKVSVTPTVANETEYRLMLNGTELFYVSTASATSVAICSKFVQTVNSLRLGVTAVSLDTYFTLEATTAGYPFNAESTGTGVLTIVETVADANTVHFAAPTNTGELRMVSGETWSGTAGANADGSQATYFRLSPATDDGSASVDMFRIQALVGVAGAALNFNVAGRTGTALVVGDTVAITGFSIFPGNTA